MKASTLSVTGMLEILHVFQYLFPKTALNAKEIPEDYKLFLMICAIFSARCRISFSLHPNLIKQEILRPTQ